MSPLPKSVARDPLPSPGYIVVTPIPLDPPVHSRPILPSLSSHSAVYISNYTFPHANAVAPNGDHVNWWLVGLFIFLLLAFSMLLSDYFWDKVNPKIWECASHYEARPTFEGTPEEEELMEEPTGQKSTGDVDVEEIYGEMDDNEWISRRDVV